MKIKNLFISLIAAAAAFVGCTVEGPTYLNEVKVSSSFVTFGPDGGTTTIDVTATDHWTIKSMPNWVSISPMEGNAGTTKVTFSAEAATDTHEGTLYIECAGAKQTIKLLQQCEKQELPIMTVAEIMAAGEGTYRAKGVCTNIYNTTYGNWHLIDETGDMTIYGTLDKNGGEKNFLSLGIEEGDIVTVEGPYTLYNGVTPELVNVTVIDVQKSLIKVSADDEKAGQINVTNLKKEGGDFVLYLVNKGEGFGVNVPEEAKSWLSFSNLELVDAASNLYKLTMNATANNAGARSAAITLKTSKDGKEYTAAATLTQEGSIVECSIAEFLAAEVGSTQYKLSGFITDRTDISGHKFDLEQYGNFDITDATGNAYVYGVGAKGDIAKYGVKEGDIITLVGLRADYKGSAQMGSGQYESHKSVTPVTAAEAAALADDDKNDPANYIRLTGKVAKPSAESGNKFDLETYGNFDLVDESGSIYVYGVSTGWNGETKKFASLGVKEGDIITIVAYKTSYKEKAQVVGMYVSHEEGKPEPELSLAHTSWYYYVPGDSDGGKMAVTFEDETKCFMVNGDNEGWWFDPEAGFIEGIYTFDAAANSGVMTFPEQPGVELALSINADGHLIVDGSSIGWDPYELEQGEYLEKPDGPEPEPGELVYSLETANVPDGSNNSYAGNCDIEVDGIVWNLQGNSTMHPWRIGGKSLEGVDRTVYTKTAWNTTLSKIVVAFGFMNDITVNSATLVYSTKEDFSEASELPFTPAATSEIEIIPEGGFPANCYYKFVFNVTVTATSNKYIQFNGVEFYK